MPVDTDPSPAAIAAALAGTEALLQSLIAAPAPAARRQEIGRVAELGDGIAIVSGLSHALADERLEFASGVSGIVFDLEPDRLGVVLLGPWRQVILGEAVRRSGQVVSVPVGAALLGRVVDALGRPRDGKAAVVAPRQMPVEREAPGILERAAVNRPLATGLTAVDAAVPVGMGQRELIIGDRQTGKTSITVDSILNQRESGVICIYCAIGQRGDAVAKVIAAITEGGMLAQSVVLVAGDDEAPGLGYIAPYAALTMAEGFAAEGHDVLVVIDDLTHHAHTYRELSLLLRRPPGREAFPGDIFYVHARLLERGGQFTPEVGGGSITILPVVETQAENLSAYIPTNLISITDGQIYLSPRLVRKNQFPAVDLGVSVSRVGGKAQSRAFRDVAGNLRVTLSQFEELEEFARFGTRLDDSTKARLSRGAAVRAALRQPERDPIPAAEQLAVLVAAMEGLLDGQAEAAATAAMAAIRASFRLPEAAGSTALATRLAADQKLSDDDRARVLAQAKAAIPAPTDALTSAPTGAPPGAQPAPASAPDPAPLSNPAFMPDPAKATTGTTAPAGPDDPDA
ncbi:F0F1 ATP synthase subunit alpha [Phaeovulum sp. W22_SRMD_FR3]|uniref:F0F1 ATP synthase subunit alpha n=1 Tax=Phaeovulum sp. W22_SRMD_FR3 TaxID=3240274 RepID=UPI003F9A04D5